MTKEKRHKRRESPERDVKVKQERLSPVRPQTSRRSRSRSNSNPGPQRKTSRTRERSPGRREKSPARRGSRSPRNRRSRSRSPHRGADVKVKKEREAHRAGGDERRSGNGQPDERRSRWESDRPEERDHGRDRHREREALASQEAGRRQHNERRRENRQQLEQGQEEEFGGTNDPPADKEQPNFELSGALTEDTNTFRGVVIKYNEPPEARIPKRRWRLYPFKDDEPLPVMYIHRQSAYLLGRQRRIADIPIDHPSCSKQHAVFQYRLMEFTRSDGTLGRRVRPYIIDLASGNGTYLNNQRIEPQRYYELKEKDVIKFGFSSREYVLLHEFSDTTEVDAKREEEEDDEGLDE
ncbi:smad nuclear-interacting protein 1 [Brachionichthys hirsutus]|uniref:smad nuclear-interacting protein 1 n=1 Tax=Brachionichthys hirsutus TaxID=412623 RepID=UPI0036045DF6